MFACSRYIELNPVRAGIVRDPAEYGWSSFSRNALGRPDPTVTPHEKYLALGADPAGRCTAYRELFGMDLEPGELAGIRADLRSRPLPERTAYRQRFDTTARMGAWDARGVIPDGPSAPIANAMRAAESSQLAVTMSREH